MEGDSTSKLRIRSVFRRSWEPSPEKSTGEDGTAVFPGAFFDLSQTTWERYNSLWIRRCSFSPRGVLPPSPAVGRRGGGGGEGSRRAAPPADPPPPPPISSSGEVRLRAHRRAAQHHRADAVARLDLRAGRDDAERI